MPFDKKKQQTFMPPEKAIKTAREKVGKSTEAPEHIRKLAAGEPLSLDEIKKIHSCMSLATPKDEAWHRSGGKEGKSWVDGIMKSIESVAKDYFNPHMEIYSPNGGIHGHMLIRNELQTLSDGHHSHMFLIPTQSNEVIIVSTFCDGQHRHSLEEMRDSEVDEEVSDHRHIVKIPIDLVLADGTEIKAGDTFLTEQGGKHYHGANCIHRTDIDGAHEHILVLSDETAIRSLDVGQIADLMLADIPPDISVEKENEELTEADLILAALGSPVEKEKKKWSYKEEDIQELLFDLSKFKSEAEVKEWMIENGFKPKEKVERITGAYSVRLAPVTEFDQDSTKKQKLSNGVTAIVGNRRIEKQTEIQTLIFPKDKFTRADAVAWAREHDFKVSGNPGVDETEDSYRIRQRDPDKFKRMRTISLPDSGGVKAVIGVAKTGITKEDLIQRVLKGVDEEIAIAKADDDKRVVLGVVLEPEFVDAQNDIMSAEDIEKTAYGFLENSRKIKFRHKNAIKNAKVVESYIAPQNLRFDGQNGKQIVKEGSWVLGVRVDDDELWNAIKKKEINAFSVGGMGRRTPEN